MFSKLNANKIKLIRGWLAQSGERPLSNPAIQGQISSKPKTRDEEDFCAHSKNRTNLNFSEKFIP